MSYGGMRYIATGRGFSIQTTDFVKMYSMYARTHLYIGFEVLFFVVTLYIVRVSRGYDVMEKEQEGCDGSGGPS